MNQHIVSKLEMLIKNNNKIFFYKYLKILNLYKFFIESEQKFDLEDQLEIITFFHERALKQEFDIFNIIEIEETKIFLYNKTKEKTFKLALEYYKNRTVLNLDSFESIELIRKNKRYSEVSIEFLVKNVTLISNVFEFNREMFQEALEDFSGEEDSYEIYSDNYCDIFSIKKNLFKEFNPSLFSSFGLTIRFCKLGQIAFKKNMIVLNENEALITNGISLGEYKVLTNDIDYLTVHIKEKFFKDFEIEKIDYLTKKISWKIKKESSILFENLNNLKNNKLLVLNFLTKIMLELLEDKNKLSFKVLSETDIVRIAKYIENNLENPEISVASLQAIFGYNKNILLQLFKDNFGISPSKYIINKKLEYSSILLIESKLSVTEISSKLNFSNSSKFSLSFRKKFFYTPLQFRKKYKIIK